MGLGDIVKGETHKKGWGEELWIVNKEGLYCGKKLFLQHAMLPRRSINHWKLII